MKFKQTVIVLMILFGVSVSARTFNTKKFYLHFPSSVRGVQIPAGVYDLSWANEGNVVDVTFSKDGHFVGSARGTWVKHGSKYPDDAALLQLNEDGTHSLIEIRFSGQKRTITFSDPILRVGANQSNNKPGS